MCWCAVKNYSITLKPRGLPSSGQNARLPTQDSFKCHCFNCRQPLQIIQDIITNFLDSQKSLSRSMHSNIPNTSYPTRLRIDLDLVMLHHLWYSRICAEKGCSTPTNQPWSMVMLVVTTIVHVTAKPPGWALYYGSVIKKTFKRQQWLKILTSN